MSYFATGDLVREVCGSKKKGAFYKEVRSRYNRGIPQPDPVVNRLVREKAKAAARGKGLILDAYPLSMDQVEGLNKIVKKFKISLFYVLNLDVPEKKLVRRLSRRRI